MRWNEFDAALLSRIAPERLVSDPDLRLAHGTDASFYRLVPERIVRLDSLDEVRFVLSVCRELGLPCTFRAAGTSLSGQALSDSVLITLTDSWRGHRILDNGARIALQPGVIGADANRYLAPLGRKIGPDPASINACKLGGIAANNASGMCCGTAHNSYHTLHAMTLLLADGTVLESGDPQSRAALAAKRPELLSGLAALRAEVLANAELAAKIRHKYRLKNTTGYAINALLDHEDPVDILTHLMIGSEGTLGFIAEVVLDTVPEYPHKASALLVFRDAEQACLATSRLKSAPVAAVELMDGRSLRSVAGKPGLPDFIKTLDLAACALLVEVHGESKEALVDRCEQVTAMAAEFVQVASVPFTSDSAGLWAIRKGLFPAVGAVRTTGTTVIIEDVAFPIERLAEGVAGLQALFDRFEYGEAIIFGHALEGNLHFVFTQGFDDPAQVARYGAFMDAVAELVAVRFGGSLKAEHGTGRNMAPYVELEWGPEGMALMRHIKALLDPDGLLNPGVIINDDPKAHLAHLKPMPASDAIVDPCIECGFCEAVCPSRTLSLSPRQRIVLYRELARRTRADEPSNQLARLFDYQGIDTCAATGLCADRCPVGINTGALIKKLRTDKYQRFVPIARWSADHFAGVTRTARSALGLKAVAGKVLGDKALAGLVNGVRHLSGQRTPAWLPTLPGPSRYLWPQGEGSHGGSNEGIGEDRAVVYLSSCASRVFGQQEDAPSLPDVVQSLLNKAGCRVIVPARVEGLCCGMPYDSKGMVEVAAAKRTELAAALWQASEQGRWPVLLDTSPCVQRLLSGALGKGLRVFEPSAFVLEHLLPYLELTPLDETVMLHITCSSRRMGLGEKMLALARACAREVIIPEHIQCCGFAGDKGLMTPELNAAALASLPAQVPRDCRQGFSNSRTCEMGLSQHAGIPYHSILYLVDQAAK
ncbi:FAD-binding and (Fe-S)-binding domain-containing protein [Aeromonas caviae]